MAARPSPTSRALPKHAYASAYNLLFNQVDVRGDMAFADFGRPSSITKRHYVSPDARDTRATESPKPPNARAATGILERETGFEPATLSLGNRKKAQR